MECTKNRIQIEPIRILGAAGEVSRWLDKRLVEKGRGTLSSSHEILGVVTEEYTELIRSVERNDLDGVRKELIDIGVACIFGIACIDSKTVEW